MIHKMKLNESPFERTRKTIWCCRNKNQNT